METIMGNLYYAFYKRKRLGTADRESGRHRGIRRLGAAVSAILGVSFLFAGPVFAENLPARAAARGGGFSSGNSQTMLYGIGSASKVVTAAAVMKLAEEGKIRLDIPLVTYIPEFEMEDDRYREITPRMLLDHSSGLPGSTLTNAILVGDSDTYNHDHLLEALKSQRLKAEPGAYSTYCNDGYSLAEILVERVSKMSFTEYLEKEFAGPLGLQNFGTPQSGFVPERFAPVYDLETGWELPGEAANVIGSGGLYATAEDLCRFAQIFMENQGKNGFRLREDSLVQMKNSPYGQSLGIAGRDTVLEYGLGWDSVNTYPLNRYGIQALSKGGDTIYYHSSLTVLPEEGISCAVLTSGGSSTFNQIAVQEILLEYLDEIGRIEREEEQQNGKITRVNESGSAQKTVRKNVEEASPEEKTSGEKTSEEKTSEEHTSEEHTPERSHSPTGWYCGRELFYVDMSGGNLSLTGSGDRHARTQIYKEEEDGKFYSQNGAYINAGGSMSRGSAGRIGRSVLETVTAEDGKTYLMAATSEIYPGLGRTAVYLPIAEKLQTEKTGNVDKTVQEAWRLRDGKEYYLVSDKYSSAAYFDRFMVKMELQGEPEGYVAFKDTALTIARIKTPVRAEFFQQVPGQAGRDLSDYEIREKNGREYLLTGSHRFLAEDDILILPERDTVVEIGPEGESLWFTSGKEHQNRRLLVTLPENGAYYIYDHGSRDMSCVGGSYLGGPGQKVTLPKDGRIVFAGAPGARFDVSYVN